MNEMKTGMNISGNDYSNHCNSFDLIRKLCVCLRVSSAFLRGGELKGSSINEAEVGVEREDEKKITFQTFFY